MNISRITYIDGSLYLKALNELGRIKLSYHDTILYLEKVFSIHDIILFNNLVKLGFTHGSVTRKTNIRFGTKMSLWSEISVSQILTGRSKRHKVQLSG